MKTIKETIAKKGNIVSSIKPKTNAIDAIKIMTEKKIGSLLVMDKEKVIGIFTEKDFAIQVISKNRLDQNLLVIDVMSTPVIAVKPEMTVEEGMAIMTKERVRHLPVIQDNQLVGLVSIGDLVKVIIDDQQSTIKLLEQYIYC
ncbi:MAG: CBS domain-containing protein [Thiotrichaceae bacterium]|nr:CBS domain-containing protein [Thiotrichaceae bacterium]